MAAQNFENHTRFSPVYHFLLYPVAIATVAISVDYFFHTYYRTDGLLLSILLVLISVGLLLGVLAFRKFPLKAQDRAIRAEENLRYFSMTGKLLDKELKIHQIVALRFADDKEFVQLVDRAVKENMSSKEIKKAIQNWKADTHRV
ncbi:MAG TPA: DUF6526 family protein [Ferruginibacter sp.]|nr:DUF6526 family protein [Ferruginibacter sp.]